MKISTLKRSLLAIVILIAPLVLSAKPNYRITVQIDHCTDTMLLLGYHYAQHTYVIDTAFVAGHGKFVFSGDKVLEPGLYFFTNNGQRYAEFVVYHEKPFFTLHTDESNWVLKMKPKGSEQNRVMFDYQRASNDLYEQLKKAQNTMDSASYAKFQSATYRGLDSLKLSLVKQHPDAMIGRMIYATKEVEVPTQNPDGSAMTDVERYNYFMQHYFDNIPLDDDFIIRTPKEIFYQRVTDYTDRYMRGMPPESIIPLLDSMIDRAEPAPEVYKWLVHTMTEKFLQSNVMVYDEVYVHLALRYYGGGKAFWSSPSVIDEQVERATKWERLLVGREAPELILFDTLHRPHSLHHMPERYTLLIFWSPTCGHCREVVPGLYETFLEMADSVGLSAFAILTETDESTTAKWKHFLADKGMTHPRWINLHGGEANVDWHEVYDVNSTPQVYLIDNQTHKFIAKKLNAQLLRDVCNQLLRSRATP